MGVILTTSPHHQHGILTGLIFCLIDELLFDGTPLTSFKEINSLGISIYTVAVTTFWIIELHEQHI